MASPINKVPSLPQPNAHPNNNRDSRDVDPKNIFDSYAHLKAFFQNSPDIAEVLKHKNSLQGKTIDLLPLRLTNHGAYSEELRALITKINVSQFGSQAKYTRLFQIQKMTNDPNQFGQIVTQFEPIPMDDIDDLKIRNRVNYRKLGLFFNHTDGICSGETHWLNYLYLNTKNFFPNPRTHFFVLGELFKEGGGIDATLMQSLTLKKGGMLGLKIGIQSRHSSNSYPEPLFARTIEDWTSKKEEIVLMLQKLKKGSYRLNLPNHVTHYIKINSKLGYYIEPNEAIIEINGKLQGECLQKLTLYSVITTQKKTRSQFINVFPVKLKKKK